MLHPYKATQDLTVLALREFWAVVADGNKGRTRRHASGNHVCNSIICGPGRIVMTVFAQLAYAILRSPTALMGCNGRSYSPCIPPSGCQAWIDRDHTQSLRLRA